MGSMEKVEKSRESEMDEIQNNRRSNEPTQLPRESRTCLTLCSCCPRQCHRKRRDAMKRNPRFRTRTRSSERSTRTKERERKSERRNIHIPRAPRSPLPFPSALAPGGSTRRPFVECRLLTKMERYTGHLGALGAIM